MWFDPDFRPYDDTRTGFADFLLDAMTLLSMVVVAGAVVVGFWWLVPQVAAWFK